MIDYAQYLGYTAFAFPLQIATNFLFCNLTKRKFYWRASHLIDLGAAVAVLVWLIKHSEYKRVTNEGFGLDVPSTSDQMFLQAILDHIRDESFNFDFLVAAVAFFFWARLLMML